MIAKSLRLPIISRRHDPTNNNDPGSEMVTAVPVTLLVHRIETDMMLSPENNVKSDSITGAMKGFDATCMEIVVPGPRPVIRYAVPARLLDVAKSAAVMFTPE